MTEHANDVIADDNAGTRQAIESIKQHKARCVTTAAWAHMGQHGMSTFPKSGSFGEWPGDQPCDIVAACRNVRQLILRTRRRRQLRGRRNMTR